MKHVSKFDGCTYEISYSMSKENGKQYDDDITLIWRDSPTDPEETNGIDLPIMEMVGWYAGDYDYEDTEWFIKDWYRKKLETKPALKKPKTMDLPICYVNFIAACLDTIKAHNLYALVDGECDTEDVQYKLNEVLTDFCEPLFEYNDTVIILEEDE